MARRSSRSARRAPRFARRSPAEWGVRAALALLAAMLGYVSIAHSLAYRVEGSDPAHAHMFAPRDGRITAALAIRQFAARPVAGQRSEPARLARLALRQDPTAVHAAATLGLQAQMRGDTGEARRVFAYAQKLSRRDFQTQLWAIEDAVGRGDIPGALKHYDLALRISTDAPALLFPVLASAIEDPDIRAALAATLARNPAWAPGFIGYLAGPATAPRLMAALFNGLRRRGGTLAPSAATATVNGLFRDDAVGEAWRFYTSIRRGADRRSSRDPGFTADLEAPSVFDWTPVNDGTLSTSIQPAAGGGVFEFSAPSSIGGVLLQQVQLLPPGDYRIIGRSSAIEQSERALPYWVMTCRDGRELGRVVVPNSARANGGFAGRFRVPADCPVQTLALLARASDAIGGVSGRIDRVRLVPAA